jgi:hypothetical protein
MQTGSQLRAPAPLPPKSRSRMTAASPPSHFSAEFALLAACCAWPPGAARQERVRAAAAAPIDWPRLLRIAERHRVVGLLADGLKESGAAVPDAIAAQLAARAQAIRIDALRHASESARLQRLFDEAGIAMLVVKGVTVDLLCYGRIGLKQARDIDILVAPDEVAAAIALLRREGYGLSHPDTPLDDARLGAWMRACKETGWRGRGFTVELHAWLPDNQAMLPSLTARAAARRLAVAPGHEVATFAEDETFAYLCLHGATHGWSRLKWLADVHALVAGRDGSDLAALAARAEALGAGRSVAQALLLCRDMFGLALPDALAARLAADRRTLWLVRIGRDLLAGRYEETEPDESLLGSLPIHAGHFLLRPGAAHKWSELRRKLADPQSALLHPLPRGLAFLQPVMSVPYWLLRRARALKRG